jgi:hypothetical protein
MIWFELLLVGASMMFGGWIGFLIGSYIEFDRGMKAGLNCCAKIKLYDSTGRRVQ